MRPLARVSLDLGDPALLIACCRYPVAVAGARLELQAFGRHVAEREAACALKEERPRNVGADTLLRATL